MSQTVINPKAVDKELSHRDQSMEGLIVVLLGPT
jgi:hypothetical protein